MKKWISEHGYDLGIVSLFFGMAPALAVVVMHWPRFLLSWIIPFWITMTLVGFVMVTVQWSDLFSVEFDKEERRSQCRLEGRPYSKEDQY